MNNIAFHLIPKVHQWIFLRTVVISIILFNIYYCAQAQEGTYLISKHSPGLERQNEYYDAVINDNGVLYIASRNGVVRYDGDHSGMINTKGSVFDVAMSQEGGIYVAGVNGLIQLNPNEGYRLRQLSPRDKSVHQVLVNSDKVYGVADHGIYSYDIAQDTTVFFQDEFAGLFYQLMAIDNEVFINTENKGLLSIGAEGLSSDVPSMIATKELVYAVPSADGSKYAVVDVYGDLFVLENGKYKEIPIDEEKHGELDIVNALWYGQNKLAIGTLTKGVLMINCTTGELLHEIGYQTGIDDNEVRAMLLDKNGGILVLNKQSLALVSPNIPIMSFSHYQGLQGELLASAHINNQLLVGTNLGLFRLEKIEDYKEVVSYQRKLIPATQKTIANKDKKRKGLFGFKKKKKASEQIVENTPAKVSVQKKVEKQLLGTYYVFKPVDSLITHANQILEFNGQTIVSGLSGIYSYTPDEVKRISDEPIRYCYLSNDNTKIFACTDDRILVYLKRNGQWVFHDVFTDLRAHIVHIVENNGSYWMSSPDKVFKIELDGMAIMDAEEFDVYNPFYSDLYFFNTGKGLSLIGNSGKYHLQNDKIQLNDTTESIANVILDNNNRVWQQDSKGWKLLTQENKEYLVFKAFTDLRHIYHNENTHTFWAIASNNKLLKFKDDIAPPTSKYVPRLDEIKSVGEKTLDIGDFEVQQEESSLSFRITHSDLSQLYNTQYRYQLNGLEGNWSEWSGNNIVSFSFLPPGDYTLYLEGRNAFGQEYQIPSINFSVLPPYWQQPWFYAFEVCIIILLLFISIKLKSWGFKYRLLSRLLAFLTLVIILEYLEAIMEQYFAVENSPIFSFALQVVMAIIILPFEGLLKKYIFKEKDVNLSEYLSIKEKRKINTKREE